MTISPHIMMMSAVALVTACHDASRTASEAPTKQPAEASSAGVLDFAFSPDRSGVPISAIFVAQVALDRQGYSPGLIDGKPGRSFQAALAGFQQAQGLQQTGTLDATTRQALSRLQSVPAITTVTIPAAFAKGPFYRGLPHETAEQAHFDYLGYRTMTEALAERFHTTPEVLIALNGPRTTLGVGKSVRVPNIANVDRQRLGKDERGWNRTLQLLGVSPDQPRANRIVVDKSDGQLQVFDKQDRLVAQFPVTTGSDHDPLPIGMWAIKGISRNPDYHYNPDLFWDADKSQSAAKLPPGPNGPVGVVWIDLSKPHYGIHGTPEPQNIGRTESHGCVRLTNWDAARLAQMVSPDTQVVFQA